MINKVALFGIAVVAVGLVALPQTLALFAGQHNFYTLSKSPKENYGIPCQKCHADVYYELAQSGPHESKPCTSCHIVVFTWDGYEVGGNKDIHAAALPACLDCHDGSLGKDARGILNASSLEAHVPFANQSKAFNLLKGSNEACISCHTHIAVDIHWEKAYKINFTAVEQGTTGKHTWSIGNFTTEGRVYVTTYGNRTGETTGFNETNITITPEPPGYDPSNP